MIGQSVGHYKILEEIGRGGMGIVYKAQDTNLQRIVAIKFLPQLIAADQAERKRFKIEAQTAAGLNHPNIATIHAIEETEGQMFLVMEYIAGCELGQIITADGSNTVAGVGRQLSLEEIQNYACQIAAGMQAAHDHGIVHRDIKSSNIMVTLDGQVKVMDFGLARYVDGGWSAMENCTVGTAAYMSPEQAQGEAVDQRSDIWSFGVVLYEMLSGELPFRGVYEQALIYAILNEEPAQLQSSDHTIPPYLLKIVYKCLQKTKKERYDTAAQIITEIMAQQAASEDTAAIFSQKDKHQSKFWHLKGFHAGLVGMIVLLALVISNLNTITDLLGLSSLPQEKHIIVLPFANVAGDVESQAFCDGLVEVLTSKMTQFEQFQRSLLVIPASEVRQMGIKSASQARKNFNANLAISGSVLRTEKKLRLTMNLVDAEELRQIDSIVLTNDFQGGSNFQDRIVTHLAHMLRFNLQPHNKRLLVAGHTRNTLAYDYYVQGHGYLRNFDRLENIDKAIDLFSRAIRNDSSYALAWSGLGEAYWRKYMETKDAQWISKAQGNCRKALSLNDLLAPVRVTLGILAKGTGNYKQAVDELKRALEIDPVNSDALRELAGAYALLNQSEKVEETYLKAIELKPGYWQNYYELALFYYRRGEYKKAGRQYQFVSKLSPHNYKAPRNLGVIYLLREQYEKAQIMCERSIAIKPNYGAYANLGLIHFTQKRYAESARMYEKALEMNDNFYVNWGNLAISYNLIPKERYKAKATFGRAIKLAEKQLAINPSSIKGLRSLAGYYAALKQFDKTIIYLEKALQLAPDDVELMFQAAGRYLEMRDISKALAYVERALKNGYSPQKIKKSDSMKSLMENQDFIAIIGRFSRSK